jgi:hypothetical protein
MLTNLNSYNGNELNAKGKKPDFLNLLEKKCEGLENLLYKNYINNISKKIDSIEQNISEKLEYKNKMAKLDSDKQNQQMEDVRISRLNQNLNVIENSFNNNLNSPDVNSSEIIRKKIEENYMLLDELEKTNRPIFTKSTEINNQIFIEDKIKEMDDKLSTLFRSENAKLYSARNFDTTTKISNNKDEEIKERNTTINKQNEREKKIQELYAKLGITEKRIKDIAGNLLKNF